MLLVVINPKGVNIRTAPTTAVTVAGNVPAGNEIEISHTAKIGKDEWGKVKDKPREYVAITQGGIQYCVQLIEV